MEIVVMKYKMLAFILALTLTSWAQTTTTPMQSTDSGKPAATEIPCGDCCAKMGSAHPADHKGGEACMHHQASRKDTKDAASCCSGKDAASACSEKHGKSCAKGDKNSADRCGSKCGHKTGGCSEKAEQTAQNCCGGSQCGHQHKDTAAPGN
jgi:hypothetical protein